MRAAPGLVREAAASARSQPVASALTLLMVAGMILAVMLTTGRTVGAEQQVLSSIDSAGTRSITVRADAEAGLTVDVLERIRGIDGIEWSGAFSLAMDATSTLNPDGTRVPVRFAYGDHLERLGVPTRSPVPGGLAYASAEAAHQFGLVDGVGGITVVGGDSFALAGTVTAPDFLAVLAPLVIIPQPEASGAERVSILVVIAAEPELVGAVSDAVLSVLAVDDPSKVSVSTSESLAALRGLVQDQLVSFSRGLVLALLVLTASLVSILLYGLVMMRRKDFGRRRALGATRGFIVRLLLAQTGLLALAGVLLGLLAAVLVLVASGDPLPGPAFMVAIGVLALAAALLAALVPALVASRREPINELRVP